MLDAATHSVRDDRFWAVIIGCAVMVVLLPPALVSPLTLKATTPFVVAVSLLAGWSAGYVGRLIIPPLTRETKATAAFLGFAACSAIWAVKPAQSLGFVLSTALAIYATGILVRSVMLQSCKGARHIAEGLWIGFLVGLLYLCAEAFSGQSVKIFVYNALGLKPGNLDMPDRYEWVGGHITSVTWGDLTLSFMSLPLIVWGALLSLVHSLPARLAKPVASAVFLLTLVSIFASPNETAKVAILAGATAFGLSLANAKWTSRLIQVVWVTVCLGIFPITEIFYSAGLHQAPWIQTSGQDRIMVWKGFAEDSKLHPLLGAGASMAYYRTPVYKEEGKDWVQEIHDVHNVYLQVWYELGAIGAALFAYLGVTLLQRIRRLPSQSVPYAHAVFTSGASVIATFWGVWRAWFNLSFAVAVLSMAIGVRIMLRKDQVIAERTAEIDNLRDHLPGTGRCPTG